MRSAATRIVVDSSSISNMWTHIVVDSSSISNMWTHTIRNADSQWLAMSLKRGMRLNREACALIEP
jgi:hypothetical protein